MNNSALFSAPFRPFFWFGSLCAILCPMYWVTILINNYPFSDHFISPLNWHGFEMIFGFSFAIITGFLLTASSHWTNSPMITKAPLSLLFFLWLAERIVLLIPNLPGPIILLVHFLFSALLLLSLIKIFKNDKKRLILFGGVIGTLMTLKMFFLFGVYLDRPNYLFISKEISLLLILFLIILISGKIIPFFTSKTCPEIMIPAKPLLDNLSILSVLVTIIASFFLESSVILGVLYFLTFLIHLFRFLNWSPLKTLKHSLLSSLHLGYAWLLIYFLIKGFSQYYVELNDDSVALHSFTLGSLSVFIYAMMTRVSLGHTGRPLKPSPFFLIGLGAINLGALIRTLVPLFLPDSYLESLHWAMGFWTLGFLIYLVSFTSILWTPRPDSLKNS